MDNISVNAEQNIPVLDWDSLKLRNECSSKATIYSTIQKKIYAALHNIYTLSHVLWKP